MFAVKKRNAAVVGNSTEAICSARFLRMVARSAKPASAQAITARAESRQQIPQRPLGALEMQTMGRIRLENGWLSDGEENFASGRRGFEH
jgi:hypothetical protein